MMRDGLAALADSARSWRVPWVEVEAPTGLYVNLDGEPTEARRHRFEVEPGRIRMHLPEGSPVLSRAPA